MLHKPYEYKNLLTYHKPDQSVIDFNQFNLIQILFFIRLSLFSIRFLIFWFKITSLKITIDLASLTLTTLCAFLFLRVVDPTYFSFMFSLLVSSFFFDRDPLYFFLYDIFFSFLFLLIYWWLLDIIFILFSLFEMFAWIFIYLFNYCSFI